MGLVGCGERGRPEFYSGCCGKSLEGGKQRNNVGWPLLGLGGEWTQGSAQAGDQLGDWLSLSGGWWCPEQDSRAFQVCVLQVETRLCSKR